MTDEYCGECGQPYRQQPKTENMGKKGKELSDKVEQDSITERQTLTDKEFYGSLNFREKRLYDKFKKYIESSEDYTEADKKKAYQSMREFMIAYKKEGENIRELKEIMNETNLLLV